MKMSHLLLTSSLCAVATAPAFAQSRAFSDIDTDGNGTLTVAELVEVFGASTAEEIILRADRDDDGELTRLEIRASFSDDEEDDDEEDDGEDDDDEEDDDEEDDDEEDDDEEDDGEEDDGEEDDGEEDDGEDDDGEDDDGEEDDGEDDDGEDDED